MRKETLPASGGGSLQAEGPARAHAQRRKCGRGILGVVGASVAGMERHWKGVGRGNHQRSCGPTGHCKDFGFCSEWGCWRVLSRGETV